MPSITSQCAEDIRPEPPDLLPRLALRLGEEMPMGLNMASVEQLKKHLIMLSDLASRCSSEVGFWQISLKGFLFFWCYSLA